MKTIFQRCTALFLACAFCLLLTGTAFAHKVRIFAYEENGAIVGETAFSGGRPARDAEILVKDAATGTTLATTRTDAKGTFHFQIPEQARRDSLNLQLIVNAGEGHRGEWVLTADEYLPASDLVAAPNAPAGSPVESVEKTLSQTPDSVQGQAMIVDETMLRRVVEEALEKKLGPVKHMLAAAVDQGPRLQDILGGIGYLIGLAGIIAYFKSKTSGEKENR